MKYTQWYLTTVFMHSNSFILIFSQYFGGNYNDNSLIPLYLCKLHFFCLSSMPLHLFLYFCLLSAVADLQRMFPTPPSLEQHPAFSPIMTYRDTPSQEPPAPSGAAEHLLPLASTQVAEYRMEMDESMASPRQEDIKVRIQCPIKYTYSSKFSLVHHALKWELRKVHQSM